MNIFIGMETSGELRRRFLDKGHFVVSVDFLSADDDGAGHIQGDVLETFWELHAAGVTFDLGVFHPTCTLHTVSAAWALKDPDYMRYPGVGYHMRVKPGTLTGKARRDAREIAEAEIRDIWALPIKRKAVENPIGTLSTRWMKPTQVFQPNWFGDNASKATCLWLDNLPPLTPTQMVPGRMEEWPRGSGKMVERWENQTPGGQNKLTPSDERWKDRSKTYPGPAQAMVDQWGNLT